MSASVGRIVRRLKEERVLQGLSQQEVADRIGTTQSAISEIETGAVGPRLSTVERYADALGLVLRVTVKGIR